MTIKIYYTADGLPPYPIFKDDGKQMACVMLTHLNNYKRS